MIPKAVGDIARLLSEYYGRDEDETEEEAMQYHIKVAYQIYSDYTEKNLL